MGDRMHPGMGDVETHRWLWSEVLFNEAAPMAVRAACVFRYAICMLVGQARYR